MKSAENFPSLASRTWDFDKGICKQFLHHLSIFLSEYKLDIQKFSNRLHISICSGKTVFTYSHAKIRFGDINYRWIKLFLLDVCISNNTRR